MPVSLSQIAGNTASVTTYWESDSLTIIYYPGHVTDEVLASVLGFNDLTMAKVADALAALNKTLVQLIKSWDAYEDEACSIMIPLTEERLAQLPIPFRMKVLFAIAGDINPESLAPQMN